MKSRLRDAAGITLTGSLAGHTLNFFSSGNGKYSALQGLYATLAPGLYPLALKGTLADGTPLGFTQNVFVKSGNYIQDVRLQVDPAGLDPMLTVPEDAQWAAFSRACHPRQAVEWKILIPG